MKRTYRPGPSRAFVALLLAVAALSSAPAGARAEPVIVGRILIGGPSDNGVDTGQGYYPGGNGFVPGYGNYPDPYYVNSPQLAINFWKWRGPPPAAAVVDPEAGVDAAAAVLRLRVPAGAEVWMSDSPTTQRGEWRRFVTPPLEAGRNQGYEVRARWTENGKPVERTEVVRVRPGDRLTVDFVGEAEELAPPRDLPKTAGR